MEPTPPLPATPDPHAAGLLSVREPMTDETLWMCEQEIASLRRGVYSGTADLFQRLFNERNDLARVLEEQQAENQHLIDDANAEAETTFHDQRKYRELVRETMRSLLVGQWRLLQTQERPFLQAYTARIHEAARALGLTL